MYNVDRYPDTEYYCTKCGARASKRGHVNDWYGRCTTPGHDWVPVHDQLEQGQEGVVVERVEYSESRRAERTDNTRGG